MADDLQPGPRRGEIGERGGGAVARAVVDIDQLEGAETGAGRFDVADERRDVALFIAHRHDDAEAGLAG